MAEVTRKTEQANKLPKGWTLSTVGRVGTVRRGGPKSSTTPDLISTKAIRAANITSNGLDLSNVFEVGFTPSERAMYSLKIGDVILAEASGTPSLVGRSALWNGEIPGCCYLNTLIRFRPHATSSDYALIVFKHYAENGVFEEVSHGIGIQHLSGARFAQMAFPLPPLDEQGRIVTEVNRRLEKLHEAEISLRSALQRISEQDKEILTAVVTGGLVEQESILAAREGREFVPASLMLTVVPSSPNRRPQRSLFEESPTTQSGYAEAGPLPPGWIWTTISAVGSLKLGRSRSPKQEHGDHPTPYLRVANVQEDAIDFDDLLLMNFTPNEQIQFKLQRDDILLNVGQSPELVGRPALIRQDIPLICFQNHLVRFRAGDLVDPEYALIVFRYYLHSGIFRSVAKWSTNLATLSLSTLADMPFPLPPIAEQKRIVLEAHRRINASKVQYASVSTSLERLVEMKREIRTAAVSGTLVPHNDDDESANSLLERLGLPPADPTLSKVSKGGTQETVIVNKQRTNRAEISKKTLAEVLSNAKQPLLIRELFVRAGYDRDSTEDVEQFYLCLRTELGRTIRQNGEGENALIEAIQDAA